MWLFALEKKKLNSRKGRDFFRFTQSYAKLRTRLPQFKDISVLCKEWTQFGAATFKILSISSPRTSWSILPVHSV